MLLESLLFMLCGVHLCIARKPFKSDMVILDRGSCGQNEFQCASKQCIDETDVCDGTAHCSDKSDETVELCSTILCPFYYFRCSYGACVSLAVQCNGVVDCIDGSDEEHCKGHKNSKNSDQWKGCGHSKFKCDSKQCIKSDRVCDGKADCSDHSDETTELCAQIHCPPHTFTCSYGGCINRRLRCNGNNDCYDGSDELYCTSNTISNNGHKCIFPNSPFNGEVSIGGSSIVYANGDEVPNYSVLLTKCYADYEQFRSKVFRTICVDGEWDPSPPLCPGQCLPIDSVTNIQCKTNNEIKNSCKKAINSTISFITCDYITESTSSVQTLIRTCIDGNWNNDAIECSSGLHPKLHPGHIYYDFN